MRCASTGAGSSTSRQHGCFPVDAGAPRAIPSTPRLSGWPAGTPPNEPVLSTGTSIPTLCVIALPRTCSKAEPICAPSRCCWDIVTSKRPRFTCTSPTAISAQLPVRWMRSPCQHPENRYAAHRPASAGEGRYCWISWQHQKVLLAITRCRTAALGGHRDRCSACGHTTAISYNSCRNRHCPRCQANARLRWLQAWEQELLPTRYVHLVFTLPRELAPLALQNKRVIYNLLFQASAATLLEMAADPKHLGAEIGFFSVLHTWNQKLQHHPHVHCVVATGGLSWDHTQWVRPRHNMFFLPVGALSKLFRGKFVAALQQAYTSGQLQFHGLLRGVSQPRLFRSFIRQLFVPRWVVYCKPAFGGPEQVLRFLGAYTHRVAISNRRLVSFGDDRVTFRWRDSAHKNKQRLLTVPVDEFLRRFLLHVLPRGFVRIRHFGFLASRRRGALVPLCKRLLSAAAPATAHSVPRHSNISRQVAPLWTCPLCGASMLLIERLTAAQIRL